MTILEELQELTPGWQWKHTGVECWEYRESEERFFRVDRKQGSGVFTAGMHTKQPVNRHLNIYFSQTITATGKTPKAALEAWCRKVAERAQFHTDILRQAGASWTWGIKE